MEKRLHILLAEDDPVSSRFLAEVLSAAGNVVTVADGASALAVAKRERFDLLVLDQNLPQLGGSEIVAALRVDALAASSGARTIALSAGLDEAGARRLQSAGFDLALPKPINARTLLDCARGQAHPFTSFPPLSVFPILDDVSALRALGGSPDAVRRIRTLFAGELPAQIDAVAEAFGSGDAETVTGLLHRLRASCGFCGAAELEQAGQRLAVGVASGDFAKPGITAYLQAAQRLLQALGAAPGAPADS